MKFEFFIASKNLKNETSGKKISRPIVRISVLSIALAVLINIITVAVVIGFQHEVRNKVLGFGSHAHITASNSTSLHENEPILAEQNFIKTLQTHHFIKNIQTVAYKPALFQSDKNTLNSQEIQSVLIKGVGLDYDFSFFKANLCDGRLPKFRASEASQEVLISKSTADALHYKVGDTIRTFFVKNQPLRQDFIICGLFETGMEDFDKKIALADIRQIQDLNDWGIKASVTILDTLANGYFVVKAQPKGGNGQYRYDWGKGYQNYAGFSWAPTKDTVFKVIVSDYWMFIDGRDEETSIPDTAYLKVSLKPSAGSTFSLNEDGTVKKEYINGDEKRFQIHLPGKVATFEQIDGKGSCHHYVGAFELNFKDWDHYDENVETIKKEINFMHSNKDQDLRLTSLKESEEEIFVWLSFLDINVLIIIVLMLIIGIINMGSAMLVMILVKTPFIGLLKALGATNWKVRKIFLIQVSSLILKGMLWGNILALGVCFLQDYFKIIKLNPEVYYLNAVPIELNVWSILLINLLTIIVCLSAMIIPSWIIARIQPSKSIKFN